MKKYSLQFPQYHFARNMGYGTKDHIAAIKKYGPCRIIPAIIFTSKRDDEKTFQKAIKEVSANNYLIGKMIK